MSLSDVNDLLGRSIDDVVVLKHFSSVWKLIEKALEAFSTVSGLPIFVYFREEQIFASTIAKMPVYCQLMLANAETRAACTKDGLRRANLTTADLEKNVQMCHAGMINGRREIQTEIGTITILFGSISSPRAVSVERRLEHIQRIKIQDQDLGERLATANEQSSDPKPIDEAFFEKEHLKLLNAMCGLVERLLKSTVGFRVLTTNMAHELIFSLGELGHVAAINLDILKTLQSNLDAESYNEMHSLNSILTSETRLGLYLVRNILSHTSEATYAKVVKPAFSTISLSNVLEEMVELYKWRAREKDIVFEIDSFDSLPPVKGLDMEIRRVFHNVLNNALKYSYHSIDSKKRLIRIKFKIPYDPGFHKPSFAIIFENYGLGLSDEEQRIALKAGVRGKQAIREVPIGAGIGLSEVEKIMRIHKGSVKIQSKPLHLNIDGGSTYLTEVKLIFPYKKY